MSDAKETRAPSEQSGASYLTEPRGIGSWLLARDHKRIGLLYLGATLAAFLLGGFFALLMRTELLTPEQTVMDANTYNRIFTAHGVVMIFLFLAPALPAAIGNFVLPLMLGAKNVAFPRLNLASFWLFGCGSLVVLVSLLGGVIDTGWTFYAPYSTSAGSPLLFLIFGLVVIATGVAVTSVNFLVTIHRAKPQKASWLDQPLFVTSLLATSVVQLAATPALFLLFGLLVVERTLGIGVFDPALGGDPLLFQNVFWFYAHPAIYVMVLPAIGLVSEIVAVFSGRSIVGHRAIAASVFAIGFVALLVWGEHMFTAGQSERASSAFSLLTTLVAIPSAIVLAEWLATMYRGAIRLETPMVYALAFIVMYVIGGLSGVFLATLSVGVQLHDTYFSVAHLHYTIVGGAFFALLGAIHYWWPKISGRIYDEKWGRLAAVLLFIGFNATFFVQFVIGARGMPRRYFNYPEEFTAGHVVSTLGAYATAFALLVVVGTLVHSLVRGERAPTDPWGSRSREWTLPSPPAADNASAQNDS